MLDCVSYAKSENNSKKGPITGKVGFGKEDLEGCGRRWACDMGTRQRRGMRLRTQVGRVSKTGVRRTWGQIPTPFREKLF